MNIRTAGKRACATIAAWWKTPTGPRTVNDPAEFAAIGRRTAFKIAGASIAAWALNDHVVTPATAEIPPPSDAAIRTSVHAMPCVEVPQVQADLAEQSFGANLFAGCVALPLIEEVLFRLAPLAMLRRIAPWSVDPRELFTLGRGPTLRFRLGLVASAANAVFVSTEESLFAQYGKNLFLWALMRRHSAIGSMAGHSVYNFCQLLTQDHRRQVATAALAERAAACFKK